MSSPPLLSLSDVDVTLDGTSILHNVTTDVRAGTWVGLIGPNGSGKTTLLRAIGGHLPVEGTLQLDGKPLQAWTAQERARRVAFVRQAQQLAFDFTVEELVLLGRSPHTSWLTAFDGDDRSHVERALAQVDLQGFGPRSVLTLSGGEMQRVFLAQALVQDADLLLLDEPTSHLDVHYQFSFMEQVQRLVTQGRTVLAVVHDLEQAARYADRLLIMSEGRLVADGPPTEVLTPACIARVFRMRADVTTGPDGHPRIVYHGPAE